MGLQASILQTFFGKSKPMMVLSEEDAVKLNKNIFDLLVRCETDLAELRTSISSNNASLKEAKLAEIENKFLNIRAKIDAIRNDMKNIIDIETQNKDFILFNDDNFIQDKMKRLDIISTTLDELLELTGEKPAASELRGMVDYIYGKINILIDAVNNIISDDKHLDSTYSKLLYL
jgi:hypothetical protein